MKLRILLAGFIVIYLGYSDIYAQSGSITTRDVRRVKDKPTVFLSVERKGRRNSVNPGESTQGVWLRLHNNSVWQVGVCIYEVPPENGDVGVDYEVEKPVKRSGTITRVATNPEGSCSRQFVESGKSILFSVPSDHLVAGSTIRIAFRFEWETDPDGFTNPLEPKHYVYVKYEDSR